MLLLCRCVGQVVALDLVEVHNLIGGLSNVLEQRSDKKVDILDAMRDALNFADAGIKALKKKSK